ncbi:head-tail connector protein [Peptostreptococcus sp. D1]|uniref:head-tail connector protein n=1 Tax=Peptostreptococcus sp. D1 TaxID=72304 RepID=UPI0008E987C4|nr:head-tail connector protein [Peptostreptococcus sp. D1]SFE87979.1 uncharacterized phage protein (possible DNA packaging) [Peptostreptococcus sp. D1]
MDLDFVKNYLRVDNDEDDSLINHLIKSANAYMRGAIDEYDSKMEVEAFKLMAQLVMLTIISEWYDNRLFTKNSNYDKVSKIVTSMIQQLQYSES